MSRRVDHFKVDMRTGAGDGDGEILTVVQVVEERSSWTGRVHTVLDGLDGVQEAVVSEGCERELVYARRTEGRGCIECVPEAPEEVQHGEEPADVVGVPVGDDDV